MRLRALEASLLMVPLPRGGVELPPAVLAPVVAVPRPASLPRWDADVGPQLLATLRPGEMVTDAPCEEVELRLKRIVNILLVLQQLGSQLEEQLALPTDEAAAGLGVAEVPLMLTWLVSRVPWDAPAVPLSLIGGDPIVLIIKNFFTYLIVWGFSSSGSKGCQSGGSEGTMSSRAASYAS